MSAVTGILGAIGSSIKSNWAVPPLIVAAVLMGTKQYRILELQDQVHRIEASAAVASASQSAENARQWKQYAEKLKEAQQKAAMADLALIVERGRAATAARSDIQFIRTQEKTNASQIVDAGSAAWLERVRDRQQARTAARAAAR